MAKTEMEKRLRQEEKMAYNRGIVYEAIVNNPQVLKVIKNKYLDDDMLAHCIENEPSVFQYIKNPSMRIIKVGLGADGANLAYIPKQIRKTLPPVCFVLALQSNPKEALKYIPSSKLEVLDDTMKETVFSTDPELVKQYRLKLKDSYLQSEIAKDPSLIKHVSDPSEELKCLALEGDPNTALYWDNLTPKMMDIIDKKYPELRESLPNYRR